MRRTPRVVFNRTSGKSSPDKNLRIYFLAFFVLFAFGAVIIKLLYLQIISRDSFTALAENQHKITTSLEARRGEIFLQDENDLYPLAINQQLQMAYAVPREVKDRENVISQLSSILSMDRQMVESKFDNPNSMFEIIKHKLSDEEVDKIRQAKLAGIYLIPEVFRYYPAGELASQLVGFVGSDGQKTRGMYGLEAYWNEKLSGENGSLSQERDSRGRWISVSDRQINPAKDGVDLVLTINHTVQYEIEKILKESLEKFAADSGTIVVLEPKTGKILALANQPGFNPNDFSKTEDISLFSNPAVSAAYESGSVFKTFTEAIGIDDGKISPETTYVDTGIVNEAGFAIQNSDKKANGVQTMTQVLENSLNTGVIFIEKQVGNRKFAEYVKRFGFGEKTGIDLPGEAKGNIANMSDYRRDINFYTISFGQGITVTPIQLAAAYGALANKGMLMKPHIIEKIRHWDGTEEEIAPEEVRQVVSENTAQLMGAMLRSVVVNGHGKRADVPGYQIGGKTGTAQIAKENSRGYEEGMNIGSFAGYGPVNDPKFVIVVKLYNPKNVEWAESSAAPTFGRAMKFLLEYYKIKPTEDPNTSPQAKMVPIVWSSDQAENEDKQNSESGQDQTGKEKKEKEKKKD